MCNQCAVCCKRVPCVTTVEDIKKIADYAMIPVHKMLKKYFILDFMNNDFYNEYYILPRRKNEKTVKAWWSWRSARGPCVFLAENNQCIIHPVKPKGGKSFDCEIHKWVKIPGRKKVYEQILPDFITENSAKDYHASELGRHYINFMLKEHEKEIKIEKEYEIIKEFMISTFKTSKDKEITWSQIAEMLVSVILGPLLMKEDKWVSKNGT